MCLYRFLLLCGLTVFCVASLPASAVLTAVSPREIFTVTEVVPPGHIVMFTFQLNPEYLLAVTVEDKNSGAVLHTWKDRAAGMLNIPPLAKKRTIQFHFNNVDSLLNSVYINFDIRTFPDPSYGIDQEQLDPIEAKVRALFDKVQSAKSLQQTLRYQQKDHRATVEDASERVLLWSILQVVGFVVACGGQLYLLRLFLEKKRTV